MDNYSIHDDFSSFWGPVSREGEYFAIVDKAVDGLIDFDPERKFVFEPTEAVKTWATVIQIIDRLLEIEATRNVFLIGMGGGVTTDITGFVASIYKRGVRYGLVPTTLVSQIDAAIGGKNGINHNGMKNELGTISEPSFIYIVPSVLKTLPERERLSGVAELIKIFMISGERNTINSFVRKKRLTIDLITKAIECKMQIVEQDRGEKGVRRKLNLGHTFGHAIEKCTDRYNHGEAVAIGMILAAKISRSLNLMSKNDLMRLHEIYRELDLPEKCDIPKSELFEAIKNDKKCAVKGQRIFFIMPVTIGKVEIYYIGLQELKELLNDLR
ncbi:MAG: 3-dehydroquinate synthase [Bacteroidales bacterium]|nr:3-dehydroquinate synthase [Bacteroidales bacterium]